MVRGIVFTFVYIALFAVGQGAPSYLGTNAGYSAPSVGYLAPAVGYVPDNADAQAAALTNSVGAKATAAKIDAAQWKELDAYGHEIGVPLLAKLYGPLTSLYAASLPPRSFTGQIDPTFYKDSYGNVKFISDTSIGVAAV